MAWQSQLHGCTGLGHGSFIGLRVLPGNVEYQEGICMSDRNHLALITKTTSLIAAGDIVGAESALAELADAEGDNALMVVLDQIAPKDILAVMREYDDAKASVVNMLVTPEQFARAMVLQKQYSLYCKNIKASNEVTTKLNLKKSEKSIFFNWYPYEFVCYK